jgi:hypothetical protein
MENKHQNKKLKELDELLEELMDILKYPIHRPRSRFITCGRCCEILSVNSSENKTIIQMKYYASPQFFNGGWVCIEPETFIRQSDTDETLPMIEAVNIPVSPKKHYFKHHLESLSFQLIFPPIPKHWKKIDLIEKEPGDATFFNFYGIDLNPLPA